MSEIKNFHRGVKEVVTVKIQKMERVMPSLQDKGLYEQTAVEKIDNHPRDVLKDIKVAIASVNKRK